jgi:hypothetical protein
MTDRSAPLSEAGRRREEIQPTRNTVDPLRTEPDIATRSFLGSKPLTWL